jgi:hypothetical protein
VDRDPLKMEGGDSGGPGGVGVGSLRGRPRAEQDNSTIQDTSKGSRSRSSTATVTSTSASASNPTPTKRMPKSVKPNQSTTTTTVQAARFQCPRCPKNFTRIENLTRHQANRMYILYFPRRTTTPLHFPKPIPLMPHPYFPDPSLITPLPISACTVNRP